MPKKPLKIALVHDYLREYGGAERVLEALHEIFPDAPVYVALYDKKRLGQYADRFAGWDIRETPLKWFPFAKRLVSPYRIFSAWAFEQLDLSEFDVVISSTNMYMAKAVRVRPGAKHISYVHTPPRSLYGLSTMMDWKKNPIIRVAGELINFWMRYVDFQTAQRPDILIANSKTTQERIAKYYRRDSVVIYPPVAMVDKNLEILPSEERTYALFVGRLARSKHPEIALQACMAERIPLKIVGVGSLLPMLKEMAQGAKTPVEFLGAVDDEQLAELYQHARVLLFPAEDEDFGIVPIEAMAAGTPVIAHKSGEPRFTVKDGETGVLVEGLEGDEWSREAREAWEKQKWDSPNIQKSMIEYSKENFERKITELLRNK